jgi:DNA-binding CsgD family transcriptional regulator
VGDRERNRCRERLDALSLAGLDAEEARRAAIAELRRAVGFDQWCWPLTDPDSGLATGGIGEFEFWPSLPRLVALEEHGDLTRKPRLIVGARASVSLSDATRGDLARSRRWRECLRPYGIGDELMTVCRDRHGCWGSVELMRDSTGRTFDDDDARLLQEVAPMLGRLLRCGIASDLRGNRTGVAASVPGTLILGADLNPSAWTPAVREWLADLPAGGETLPPAIYEIGARVLTPDRDALGLPVRVRIRSAAGRWSVIEGARLEGDAQGSVAITIRAATVDEVFDLLCKVHGLTRRERELLEAIRAGLATRELAVSLGISEYTVQDHLKAIFDKTGVRSRRELVSHLAGVAAIAT